MKNENLQYRKDDENYQTVENILSNRKRNKHLKKKETL